MHANLGVPMIPKTLVMIPTFNESNNLPKLVKRIMAMRDIGVVVVDDNSPDGTGSVAETLAKKYKGRIHVVHRTKRGRGTAGIVGLKKCVELGTKYVIEMDADFSHDPKYIQTFLKLMDTCDVVIGSRFVKGGKDVNRGFLRKWITMVSHAIYSAGLRTNIRDMGSGFKCYKASVLKSVDLDKFVSKGFSISMELNYKIKKKGFKIKEYPIEFVDRESGQSKLKYTDFIESIIVILKLNLMRK